MTIETPTEHEATPITIHKMTATDWREHDERVARREKYSRPKPKPQRHRAQPSRQSTITMHDLRRIAEDPRTGTTERREAARKLGLAMHAKLANGDANDRKRARNVTAPDLAEMCVGALVEGVRTFNAQVGQFVRRFAS